MPAAVSAAVSRSWLSRRASRVLMSSSSARWRARAGGIPPSVTIWDAAAPDTSLRFLLVGAVVLVPMILAYTGYSYWVFRGKVRPGETYH